MSFLRISVRVRNGNKGRAEMKASSHSLEPTQSKSAAQRTFSQFRVLGWVGPGFLGFGDKEFKLEEHAQNLCPGGYRKLALFS